MAIYLVRHAHAGARDVDGRDIYRQLSDKGHRRALTIVELLDEVEIDAILSSPATRCVQTVEPLAMANGLDVGEHDDLWEDADTDDVLKLIEQHTKGNVVICSHGNLIPIIIEQIAERGAKVKGRGCEKGSIWVLDHNGKRFTTATYISKTVEMLLG